MRFTDAQHARHPTLRRWSSDEPTTWALGRRVGDGSAVHVPAELVYYPFQHANVSEYVPPRMGDEFRNGGPPEL
jgi:ribosomal protein S12 methylthiotransferase accessory factor YcaO